MTSILAIAALFLPGASHAQSAPANACVSKSDATGGRLRFVVVESDATLFEQAGFQRVSCPEITQEIIAGQSARCERLRGQEQADQDAIAALYGLSVEQMCGATDAWVSSTAAQ